MPAGVECYAVAIYDLNNYSIREIRCYPLTRLFNPAGVVGNIYFYPRFHRGLLTFKPFRLINPYSIKYPGNLNPYDIQVLLATFGYSFIH
jgi:hypothetical protein